ncbi:MAG: polysulfide reductase NrfD [Magnetococcales bacterium]|nr:polysulfide reductase NrfD [Magnetococcales bacterium]
MSRHLDLLRFILTLWLRGSWQYALWMALLAVAMAHGLWAYGHQLSRGLQVTNLSDQIVWGLYIGNFTFLVGVAAAAMVVTVPAYVFHRNDMRQVVLYGECMAITAVVMALLFVFVDLGRPERIWHALPLWGSLNFPRSILAWDMVVLSLYLLINLVLGYRLLHGRFRRRMAASWTLLPWIMLAIGVGLSIHVVTAFMFAGNVVRPFWHSAVLAPRFIASALAAGSGLMLLLFHGLERWRRIALPTEARSLLTAIMTSALLIHLFLLGSELFVVFYQPSEHGLAAHFLYRGSEVAGLYPPMIWTAIALEGGAAILLLFAALRRRRWLLNGVAVTLFVDIWLEKGLGLVVPGFIPSPLGEVVLYYPSTIEMQITLGIWAFGCALFTLLARAILGVEHSRQVDLQA